MEETDDSKDSRKDCKTSINPFKRNLNEVPCFRSSFITGIISGIAVGVVHFMVTSKTRLSNHVAVGSYVTVTLGAWCLCRYQWSVEKFRQKKIQEAIKNKILFEGTAIEQEILAQTKEA